MEDRLQSKPAPLGPRELDAERLRGSTSTNPKGLMKTGPKTGSDPHNLENSLERGPTTGGFAEFV